MLGPSMLNRNAFLNVLVGPSTTKYNNKILCMCFLGDGVRLIYVLSYFNNSSVCSIKTCSPSDQFTRVQQKWVLRGETARGVHLATWQIPGEWGLCRVHCQYRQPICSTWAAVWSSNVLAIKYKLKQYHFIYIIFIFINIVFLFPIIIFSMKVCIPPVFSGVL